MKKKRINPNLKERERATALQENWPTVERSTFPEPEQSLFAFLLPLDSLASPRPCPASSLPIPLTRTDNYACSRSREPYVMDGDGRTLLKLLKKNFVAFETWKGYSYRTAGTGGLEQQESSKPWFSVRKARRILKKGGPQDSGGAVATVCVGGEVYRIDGVPRKSEYRISGPDGEVVAETKRKQTESGVVLGEDVLSLTVGPAADADRLLLVGPVVVCGLLGRCI
ncbi:protein LURP-one-related 11-like [Miscanthus floridulus]|uniref:protein LURP-one-related 11-like n=1 Tax=Miscanthus floridulus TaxID=154761 RepID=UPI0034580463